MQKPGPEPEEITAESQFRLNLMIKLGKDDMDRNRIGVQTICAGREDEIGIQTTESPVPPAPQMVGSEPPKKICEMGPRDLRDAVQRNFLEIHVFHALGIQVDFEILVQSRDPFRDAPFGAMTLVNEGRDDRKTRFAHQACFASRPDIHRLAPALENEEAPDAGPPDGGG